MNSYYEMQGGQNWILPKEFNADRIVWDIHWLEILKNHLCLSMGPNGGSEAMDSAVVDGRRRGKDDRKQLTFV
jgi:hypothetical protein